MQPRPPAPGPFPAACRAYRKFDHPDGLIHILFTPHATRAHMRMSASLAPPPIGYSVQDCSLASYSGPLKPGYEIRLQSRSPEHLGYQGRWMIADWSKALCSGAPTLYTAYVYCLSKILGQYGDPLVCLGAPDKIIYRGRDEFVYVHSGGNHWITFSTVGVDI